MENFSELIKNRRSMRKFTDEELTQDEVVALMKAALMSPSSKRSNSWQFIVVDDKEILKELSHCACGKLHSQNEQSPLFPLPPTQK